MSDNANQPVSRTGPENSGNGGHFDQGGRRNSTSGNRNNRRRRPSQQIGGEQSANHSQRQTLNNSGAPVHQNMQTTGGQPVVQANVQANAQANVQAGKQQNQSGRQDQYQQRRNNNSNNRPQRPGQPADTRNAASPVKPVSSVNITREVNRSPEKPDQVTEKQIPQVRIEKPENQAFANRKNNTNAAPRTDRPREPRTFGRNIRTEETHEDIRRENERLEKEIWLEIASIHTYKLD